MNLEGERSLLGEEGSGCCVEGSGSGACGPWLNRVINVPANIRLAFGGARGKFHSSPVGELRQPRTIVDIITRLIKHYNCKSTEICHGRLRHCGCPLQTRLFHSLSLSLSACSRNTRCCTSRRLPSGMERETKKDVEEENVERMCGALILEMLTRR